MELIPRLPEIMPEEADERIRPLYEDIQRTLRVPFVNFIFRTLANYPDYFEAAWGHLSPALRTRAFEQAADELRTLAALELVSNAVHVEWDELGDMEQIRSFSDSMVDQPHMVADALLDFVTEHRGVGALAKLYDGFPEVLGAQHVSEDFEGFWG